MNERKSMVAKESILIAMLVCFGKIIGFVKQGVIAWAFGSSVETDLFFSADGYTSTISQILGKSIEPTVLSSYILMKNADEEKADALIKYNYCFFSFVSVVLITLSVFFSRYISQLIGISYTYAQKIALTKMIGQLSPVILLTSIAGVAQGYLNANHKYMPSRINSLFFSCFSIVTIIVLKNKAGIFSLILGFLAGYFFYTIFVVICVGKKIGFKLDKFFEYVEFKNEIKKFIPMVIGMSIVDIGNLVDRIVASSLKEGSVTALNYGQVISNDLVNAVIISTIGTVILTNFTEKYSGNEALEVIANDIQRVLTIVMVITVLVTVLYFIVGNDLVQFLLERGSFTHKDTIVVGKMAMAYALGFVFMAFREVLIKAHYAFQDMTTPVINSAFGVIVNIILSIVLSKKMEINGIALATSISMLFVAALSGLSLKKHINISIVNMEFAKEAFKVFIAAIITYISSKFILELTVNLQHLIVRLAINGISSILMYMFVCIGIRECVIMKLYKVIKEKLKLFIAIKE